MTDETYNGWANRETWLVNLWLTNDQAVCEEVTQLVRDAECKVSTLEAYVDEMATTDTIDAGMVCDLLYASIARVNWREIVANLLAD